MKSPSRPLKIVLLGEGRVGKTSILLRYAKNQFSDTQAPTTSSSFLEKRINLDGGISVVLSLWDTAGQEKYHSLGPIFYRDADAAILVFDQTDPMSFDKVQIWMKELRIMVQEEIPICIAANKCDLIRKVDLELVQEYSKNTSAMLFWTSALLNEQIDDMFLYMTRAILRRMQDNDDVYEEPLQPRLIIQTTSDVQKKQDDCC